jgi:hypothetical protein
MVEENKNIGVNNEKLFGKKRSKAMLLCTTGGTSFSNTELYQRSCRR